MMDLKHMVLEIANHPEEAKDNILLVERMLDEYHSAENYKKMAEACQVPEYKQMYEQMAHDELQHAKYFLTMVTKKSY